MLDTARSSIQGDAFMEYAIHRFAAVAAMALALSACGGGTAAVDTDTPEYEAMQYRQGLMEVISFKASRLRGMADGNIPVDEAEFLRWAGELATLAGMIEDSLVAGSDSASLPSSRALPDIWNDLGSFTQHATDLGAVAETVASQAQAGGFQAAQATASEQIAPICSDCHTSFRRPAN